MYQRAAAAGDGASMVYLALQCSKGSRGEGAPSELCWKEAFSTCFHLVKASL